MTENSKLCLIPVYPLMIEDAINFFASFFYPQYVKRINVREERRGKEIAE